MNLRRQFAGFKTLFLVSIMCFSGCSNDEDGGGIEPVTNNSSTSYTITVGVFLENGGIYTDQNKDFIFINKEDCQSWSRTAQGDSHSSSAHEHFNAAKNTIYDVDKETITWSEYGPELDQASIDATCSNGTDGTTKTANKTAYSSDKNFFLYIKSVVEN